MSRDGSEETQAFWNSVAKDWDMQVGDAGDTNRILNSDPVLWKLAGDVPGLTVLDAGCGTGYLSRQLHARGAKAVGIDFSAKMIEIARVKTPGIDFRVESCAELTSIASGSVDVVVSNYVLMDIADLDGTMAAFHRVLTAGGVAVLVFSHPCFPQGRATASADGSAQYRWDFPYFEERQCSDPPWGHFTADFIWFHRPLSAYWKVFVAAGFEIVNFDEPHLTEERYHLADGAEKLHNSKARPYSVAFKLRKPVH